jgi:hypothetical protein
VPACPGGFSEFRSPGLDLGLSACGSWVSIFFAAPAVDFIARVLISFPAPRERAENFKLRLSVGASCSVSWPLCRSSALLRFSAGQVSRSLFRFAPVRADPARCSVSAPVHRFYRRSPSVGLDFCLDFPLGCCFSFQCVRRLRFLPASSPRVFILP